MPSPIEIADPVSAQGFSIIENAVLHNTSLSLGARLVYAEMKNWVWREKGAQPGQSTLCERLGVSERALRDYLRELEEAGLLTVRRRQRQPSVYTLLDPRSRPADSADQEFRPADFAAEVDVKPSKGLSASSSEVVSRVGPLAHVTTNDEVAEVIEIESAQTPQQILTAFFVDESRARGGHPPRRVIGHMAKEVATLLLEGQTPERVRDGILAMLDANRPIPYLLPSFCLQAELPRASVRTQRGLSPNEIVAMFAD